ncbi:MAG: hypothetical protein LC667_13645, partial [Thioalkalivibrio sp.]|nr:hypothetical protein [Thioalkalivibrio sp.]
MCATVCPTGAI